jgi:hypothetical protein
VIGRKFPDCGGVFLPTANTLEQSAGGDKRKLEISVELFGTDFNLYHRALISSTDA